MPDFKPTISKVAVIFRVENLERSARFYVEKVGLELQREDDHLIATVANGTELRFFEGEGVRGTSPMIEFEVDGDDRQSN